MKALILAAGEGARLRPLTELRPKAMVSIGGQPAIAHCLRWLCAQGVQDIAINLHHHPHVLIDYVGDGKAFDVRVRYSVEQTILGTAGALGPLRDFFEDEADFLVVYGDVLTDLDLEPLWRAHRSTRSDLTIAVSQADDPTASGLIAFDEDRRISRFVEKPGADEVFSGWANGGICVCNPLVFDYLRAGTEQDFGRDIFPAMVRDGRRLFAHTSRAAFFDFGTPARLERAESWLSGRKSSPLKDQERESPHRVQPGTG
jgi:NDP-sugar pyrophosphorylase family protein